MDYFEILLNYGHLALPRICDKHTLLDVTAIMQFNSVLVPAVPNTDDMPSIMVLYGYWDERGQTQMSKMQPWKEKHVSKNITFFECEQKNT